MRLRPVLRVVAINVVILALLAALGEMIARAVYPEFAGQIYSVKKTQGINFFHTDFRGFTVRVPAAGATVDTTKPFAVIFDDSISNGYGTAYEDIYWVRLARTINQARAQPLTFIALAGYGNNLGDSGRALAQLTREHDDKLTLVLYQFNFNDITPYDHEAIQAAPAAGIAGSRWFTRLAQWRYEYLNYSVLLRVAQHYGGALSRRTSGICEERGLDTLGPPYTWTYGSRAFKTDAERYWTEFEERLADLKKYAQAAGAKFAIFVSPFVFDVDKRGLHPQFNHLNYDFTCATIDPRARLVAIAKRLGVTLIDPAEYARHGFEARLAEDNVVPFFFTADENHFTPVAAGYIAKYLETGLAPVLSSH